MSSNRQEKSIPAQRVEVQAYAVKNGYAIIREYRDEGISGDATERRLEFQRKLHECVQLRDVKAVLRWDQDRFGRFDQIEGGNWMRSAVPGPGEVPRCSPARRDTDLLGISWRATTRWRALSGSRIICG
jgi:hypothetical protein